MDIIERNGILIILAFALMAFMITILMPIAFNVLTSVEPAQALLLHVYHVKGFIDRISQL